MSTKRQTRNRENFGNPNYKGRGDMLCYLCDAPLRDHEMFQSCPAPPTQNPRIPKKQGRTRGQHKI